MQEQMKNKILYTDEARCDLDSIWDYIALDLQNQQAAERLVNKIMDRVDQLEDFAESGMLLSAISEIIGEERFLVCENYLIFYHTGKSTGLMQACYGAGDVSVALDKRIPFGAGLGGGSSDATAVILALDELFRLKLPERELIDCAAALGSDTAFFVRNTPQLCTGRGEVMTPVKLDLRGLWIAVVKPDCGVSTREAYAGIRPGVPAVPLAERIARPVTEWQTFLKNDFEPHIFAAHPEIAAAKAALLDAGAVYAAMSGSGSAVFGLFDDEEKARSRSLTPFVFPLQ